MMFIQCSIRDEILRIETSTALIIVIELLNAMKTKVKGEGELGSKNFPAEPK